MWLNFLVSNTILTIFLSRCTLNFTKSCPEGVLRLDNSTDPLHLLVMMCVQGQRGHVCGRKTANNRWTKKNVGVACQQLGLIREGISRRNI